MASAAPCENKKAMANEEISQTLIVGVMPQQRLVRDKGDDWTGVTSTSERRKLQNRLNQRAYRQRKNIAVRKQKTIAAFQELRIAIDHDAKVSDHTSKYGLGSDNTSLITTLEGPKMLTLPHHREEVLRLAKEAYEHYTLGMPRPTQLNYLIKLNVLNALARNATLIGIPTDRLCADEAISPFSQSGPLPLPDQVTWPKSLRPSSTQFSVQHHPWIDLIPFPIMRDRAIRAFEAGLLDEDELCLDLMEAGGDRSDTPFLIVWGDSSDPCGWEATLPFLEKYGWLVWGCTELFESTNRWRAQRGDKQLGL